MSSEYSIHLHNKPVEGRVKTLLPGFPTVAVRINVGDDLKTAQIVLFVPDDRLQETSLLFHKIAQGLAALLPDVDACCRCVPGAPDDQCAEHGFGAFKIKAAASCPLCGKPSPGGEAHHDCIAHEEYQPEDAIPIDDVREAVEPPHRWG